jgi:hypothetical protein
MTVVVLTRIPQVIFLEDFYEHIKILRVLLGHAFMHHRESGWAEGVWVTSVLIGLFDRDVD